MLKELGFHKGINLGGWFSQCDYSTERLDSFITEPDFRKIADWGFDHIRLPVDYNVIQNKDGSMKEDGLQRIDRVLSLCDQHGLRAVLDLHKAPGFSFDPKEQELGLFDSEADQSRFYAIWESFAARYGSLSDWLVFELLNEITNPDYLHAWICISRECISRIRQSAPETVILLGSYHNNSVHAVRDLPAPSDDHVLYNFHCYEPISFTHQGAYWIADRQDVNARVPFSESGVSPDYFEALFSSAVEKAQLENTELYCGEYGVIDIVPPEEALPWFRAIHAILEKHGIARAVWSYKEMDFGLADPRWDALRPQLLEYL